MKIGSMNQRITFQKLSTLTQDDMGGYVDTWLPAFSQSKTSITGTTTTTIKITAHGLSTGDYIVNVTRSNTLRQVTRVDANTLTVTAVTSQTVGDSFLIYGSDYSTVWAKVKPKTFSAYDVVEKKKTLTVTHIINVRYRPEIESKYRIKLGTRLFDIQSMIDKDEGVHEIEIVAIEVIQ